MDIGLAPGTTPVSSPTTKTKNMQRGLRHLSQLNHAEFARDNARAELLRHTHWNSSAKRRPALWQRAVVCVVAVMMWLSPLSVTLQQADEAAGVLSAGAFNWNALNDWMAIRTLPLSFRLGIAQAQAAPISDPNAPITFRPAITQSTGANGGVPVVNITAPNAAGISLNNYQSFNIDPIGLILNNSMLSGTSLTGGQVTANPNLTSRSASVIINQVTSTGSAFASALNGPLEVFGAPATVIIANPNGIATQGTAFTNTLGVTLTTGVPQFLTQVGGSATSFDSAQAVAYNVTGGHIQIEGNAGANGPGVGIDGTVGTIDLIAETIGINAPLYAGNKINVIAGDQLVTPNAVDASGGTTYGTTGNGSANTAAAVAANGAPSTYAIDATAYGAVTAGEIQMIGSAAGMGVRLDATMTANTGNLQLSSNGDLSVAGSAAQLQASLQSAGNTTLTGNHLGVGGYTINANGDVTSSGTLQSGQDLSVTAGGNINLANVQANGNVALNAGDSVTTATLQNGGNLSLIAQGNDGTGDVTLNGATTTTDAVTVQAARDLILASSGSLLSGTANLTAGRDIQVNGSLATGTTLTAAAQGNFYLNGTQQSGTDTTLNIAQQINLSGTLIAMGNGTLNAGTNLVGAGSLSFGNNATLNALSDLTLSGPITAGSLQANAGNDLTLTQAQVGGAVALTAAHDVNLNGNLAGTTVQITAGNDATVNNLQATSTLGIQTQGNAGQGDITLNGTVSVLGNSTLQAARDITINTAGSLMGGNTVTLTAQRNQLLNGEVDSFADMSLTATTGTLIANATVSSGADLGINAAQGITLNGQTTAIGNTNFSSAQNITLAGALAGLGSALIDAGGDIDASNSSGFVQNATLISGGNINLTGSLQANGVQITAGNSATLNNIQANATLGVQANGAAGQGDIAVNGLVTAQGNMSFQGQRDTTVSGVLLTGGTLGMASANDTLLSGVVESVGTLTLNNTNGSLTTSGTINSGADLNINAGQSINLGSPDTTVLGNTTLNAAQGISLSGTLVGQGNGTVTAGTTISGAGSTAFGLNASVSSGSDTTLTGSLQGNAVQVTAGNNASLNDVQSASTLAIQANGSGGQGDVSLTGTVNSTGAVTVQAARDVNLSGSLAGGTTVAITGQGNLNLTGTTQSASDMSLSATSGSLTASGAVGSGTSINAVAGQNVTLGNVQAATTLTAQANGGDLTLNGTATALGAATLNASGDTAISGVLAGNTVNLTSQGNVNITGSVQSVGEMNLSAVNGSLTTTAGTAANAGYLTAGGQLIAGAGQNLSLGSLTTVALNTTLTAGQSLTLNGNLAGSGSGALTAGTDLDGSGSTAFTQDAVLNANGNIALTGSFQASTLNASAGSNLSLNNVVSTGTANSTGVLQNNGTFNLNAGQDLTLSGQSLANGVATLSSGQDLSVTGVFNTGAVTNLTAARDISVSGQVAGAAQVTLQAQRNIAVGGSVESIGDMSVNAVSGNLTSTGGLNSGGALTAVSGLALNLGLGSTTSAVNGVSLTAGSDMALNGTLIGLTNGTLNATGDITGAGTQSFTQTATLSAGGNLALTGSLQANQIQATGGNNAALNNVITETTLALTANGNAGAGDASLTGTISAPGIVTVQAARDAIVSGALTDGSTLTVTGQRNVSISGNTQVQSDITLDAVQGSVSTSAPLLTNGNLLATAGQAVNIGGATTVNGNTTLSAGQSIAVTAALTSQGNGSLTAATDITGAGAIAFGGTATLNAGGNLALTGSLQGTSVQVTGGNNAGLGSVIATAGDVSIVANGNAGQGDITLGAAASAFSALTLQAARDIVSSGTLTAGTTATLTAQRNLLMTGDLNSVGDAVLTATTGQMTGADVTSQDNLSATAASTLTFSGVTLAGGNATLNSTSDMELDGGLIAANNVNLTTNGNLVAGGVVAGQSWTLPTGGSLTLTGSLNTSAAVNAVAGISMGLGSAVSGGALSLQANGTGGTGGDIIVTGQTYSGSTTTIQAARDIAVLGAMSVTTTADLTAGRNLGLGSTLAANGDVQLTATSGALTSADTITTQGNLTTVSGGATSINGALVNGNTNVTAGGDITVTGTLAGLGTGTFAATGNVNGGGALAYQDDLTITAGKSIDPPSIQTAGAFSATAGGDLEFGAITALGNVNLQSTQGSLTLDGLLTTGGTLQASAAQNLSAMSGVNAVGTVALTATNGNLNAAGVVSNADATLIAGQALSLTGTNQIAGNTTLSANSITLGGTLTGEQAFTATASGAATGNFDSSTAQLNITGNAQISGYNVSTGGLLIGGNLSATAPNQVTLSGQTLVAGTAIIGNGAAVQNNGSVLSGENLTVNATGVTNAAGASLTSIGNTSITATNLSNAGTIDGLTTTIAVSNAFVNDGSAMGVNGLTVSANSLNNTNGLLFAGDITTPTADTANLSLSVTGGTGSLVSTGGQIMAQGNLTLNLPNMAVDPSAASMGTLGAGGLLTIDASSVGLASNWSPQANTVTINATNGFSNAGTLNVSGALNISTNGQLSNTGSIGAGGAATLTGNIVNGTGALLYSGTTLTLNGSVVNRGNIESAGNLNFTGSNYDNQGASTQAQGNMSLLLTGDLQNTGGTIQAGNNLTISANTVENNQTAPSGYTSTTTAVVDPAFLWATVIGTENWEYEAMVGDPSSGVSETDFTATIPGTLGNLLSPTGASSSTVVTPATEADASNSCFTDCVLAPSSPIAQSGTVSFTIMNSNQADSAPIWALDTGSNSAGVSTFTLTLPTVYETVTSEQAGVAGVISAGGNVSLTANSLSNLGGAISAGGNLALNVQSLNNGSVAPSIISSTTFTEDQTQLNAFLSKLQSITEVEAAVPNYLSSCSQAGVVISSCIDNTVISGPEAYFTFAPETAPVSISSVTTSSPTGLISATGNLTISGGNLTNGGTIYAGQNISITAASLTNQGTYTSQTTTQKGCPPGVPEDECLLGIEYVGENPTSSTFSYQQDNATISAGNDLVIAAGNITNTYGNIIAGNNLYIGGVGTTASSTTPANSLTNTSGNIVAGNNIVLNVSGAITNTLPPPVLLHQDYGTEVAYSGCMTAEGYKSGYCEGYVEQQSANSSNISAGNGLTINAGSLTNIGSLISAGQSATLNVTGPIVNSEQTLNAYWHSFWVQQTSIFSSDQDHNIWACGTPAQCTSIYGSAYTNTGGAIDPPTPIGNIAATIQAPNLSVSSGGQIQNVGNILGTQVTLSGHSLVNGITGTNVYTPQVAAPAQVISLAPGAGPGMSQAIPNLINTSTVAPTPGVVTYVVNTAGVTSADNIGPATLLANLPANLQPSSDLFYYNPQEEDLVLQQAALAQTGQASFVNCPTCNPQSGLSVADQDKVQLYQNALNYATANNIQLGTALTQTQINQLTQPMLWYVEQTVPDPSCTATGSSTCPTVTALMPQVYLPPNYGAEAAGGTISGTNVTLNFSGSILNTGTVTASDTLTVTTPTLTNQQNQTNVGQIWNYIPDVGYQETTGTVVQPGGFMSAANMTLNVQTVNQIGGALQELNSDGTVSATGSQQLINSLQAQLGSSFTQSTVANNLNTSFSKDGGNFSGEDLAMLVVVVALTIITAGAASAAIGSTLGAGGGTFAAGSVAAGTTAGLGNVALSAAIAGMAGSAVSQVATTGTLSLGDLLESGAIAGLTAGLTNGITYNATSGFGVTTAPIAADSGTYSLATLASSSSVGNFLVPVAGQATSVSGTTLAEAALADATITAGVQTAIEGGSFLGNLEAAGVTEAAADAAGAIGNASEDSTSVFAAGSPGYIIAHAALGCAASAAEGTGCAGGAIGGATSALLTGQVLSAMDPTQAPLTTGQVAIATAIASLAGGVAAGLAGANAQGGLTAAENEALNNQVAHFGGLIPPNGTAEAQNISSEENQGANSATGSPTFTVGPNGTMSLGGGVTGGFGFYVNPGLGTSSLDAGFYVSGGTAYGFDPSLSMAYGFTLGPSSNLRGLSTSINAGLDFGGVGGGGSLVYDGNNQLVGAGNNVGIRGVPTVPGATFSVTKPTTCTFSIITGVGCKIK